MNRQISFFGKSNIRKVLEEVANKLVKMGAKVYLPTDEDNNWLSYTFDGKYFGSLSKVGINGFNLSSSYKASSKQGSGAVYKNELGLNDLKNLKKEDFENATKQSFGKYPLYKNEDEFKKQKLWFDYKELGDYK